jgi:hypothetical protein
MREYFGGKVGTRMKKMNSKSEQEMEETALQYYSNLTVMHKDGELIPPDNNPHMQALQEKLVTLTLLEKVQGGYRFKQSN